MKSEIYYGLGTDRRTLCRVYAVCALIRWQHFFYAKLRLRQSMRICLKNIPVKCHLETTQPCSVLKRVCPANNR